MPTEAELEEIIQKCKDRAEDNRLIHLKAVDGSKVEAIKAQKRLEKEIRKHSAKFTETSSSISFHTSLIISKINTHHSKLAQLSAELALSFLEGKDELEIIEMVVNGTDPDLPFDDVTIPREIYLPYAFEALRRDLVIGGACARQLGEEETQDLLDIIESAYEYHGLEVTRLVDGMWVVDSGEKEDDDEDGDEEGDGDGEDDGEEEEVVVDGNGELIIGLNFEP